MRCGDSRLGRRICWRWSDYNINTFNYFYKNLIDMSTLQLKSELHILFPWLGCSRDGRIVGGESSI
jgi:hypothetical protein